MNFADLKNDFVFRRIFAKHPHLLCSLLNDLLERRGDGLIESVEYLPSEQLPLVPGAKLSILDVRFLELPKLPKRKPETGAEMWAWLFVHAPEWTELPSDIPPGSYREAVELANQATFTQLEMEAYRKVMDEIQ